MQEFYDFKVDLIREEIELRTESLKAEIEKIRQAFLKDLSEKKSYIDKWVFNKRNEAFLFIFLHFSELKLFVAKNAEENRKYLETLTIRYY